LEEELQDDALLLHNQNIDLSQRPQALWEEGEENDCLEEKSQDDFSSLHDQNKYIYLYFFLEAPPRFPKIVIVFQLS
jgi:hypothetical protein